MALTTDLPPEHRRAEDDDGRLDVGSIDVCRSYLDTIYVERAAALTSNAAIGPWEAGTATSECPDSPEQALGAAALWAAGIPGHDAGTGTPGWLMTGVWGTFLATLLDERGVGAAEIPWVAVLAAAGKASSIESALGRAVSVVALSGEVAASRRSSACAEMATPTLAAGAPKRRLAPNPAHARDVPLWRLALHSAGAALAWSCAVLLHFLGPPARRVIMASTVAAFGVVAGAAELTASAHVSRSAVHNVGASVSLSNHGGNSAAAPVGGALNLAPANTAPQPAPPSLSAAPPLQSHEIFGFAPYWTLNQSAGFNVAGISTLAYFSIDVNSDGSLDKNGPGWNGYQSQDLASLITRAHAANDRVVLSVTDFSQSSLDELTSSPTAPTTLSAALLSAIGAKNLDGVNLDFEGNGSADQIGLTNLVAKVSASIHGANPHYQVTMDTYASSAGDPHGFYNIPALSNSVDAFFVMAYELNLESKGSATSPLTSTMFSNETTLEQYTSAIPASKVILGMPFYGYDWPTTDGTLTATATGQPATIAYSQVAASGHPIYWDSTTQTAWTSYQVGAQWHESFFEDPSSLYLAAQLGQWFHVAGLGIWTLGYDGNDPTMLAALQGFAPPLKDGDGGPSSTSASAPAAPTTPTTTPATQGSGPATTPTQPTATGPTTAAPSGTTAPVAPAPTTTSTTSPESSTTTTTTVYSYTGTWLSQTASLTPVAAGMPLPSGLPTLLGTLTHFATDDPAYTCLSASTSLSVWAEGTSPTVDVVSASQPADCVSANFILMPAAGAPAPAPMPTTPPTTVAPTTEPALLAP